MMIFSSCVCKSSILLLIMRNIMRGVCDYHCNVDVTSGEMCCLEGRRGQEGVGEDAGKRENVIFFKGCISLL
jgi:hypothetical protein